MIQNCIPEPVIDNSLTPSYPPVHGNSKPPKLGDQQENL